ncbi:14239_t:CDS:2, partial [Dentiscutata heterogama]
MNKLEEVVVVVPEKSKRQDEDHSENKSKRAKLDHVSVAKALKSHKKMVVNKQELVVLKESVFGGPSIIDRKMQVNMHQDTVVVKSMHISEVLAELEVSKENGRSMNSRTAEHYSQVAEAAISKGRKWKRQQPAERVFMSSAVSNKENSNPKVEGPTSKPKEKQVQDLNEEIKLEFQFKSIFDEILVAMGMFKQTEGLQDNLNARQGSTFSSSMGNRCVVTE